MDRIHQAMDSTTNFVRRHKTAIAVTATVAICAKLNRIAVSQHDQFLKDHNLLEAFYNPED